MKGNYQKFIAKEDKAKTEYFSDSPDLYPLFRGRTSGVWTLGEQSHN